jgi:Adenylylsulphate kinase
VAFATRAPSRPTQQGVTVWLTGLPSAGKTAIADLVGGQLAERGRAVEVLAGDVVRTHLSKGLGFSKADRDENIRRIGFVAGLLTGHGVTVRGLGGPGAGPAGAAGGPGAGRDRGMTADGRAAPPATDGRAAPPATDGRAPNREGSRAREVGPAAVHSPHPHGGRPTERLVAADRADDPAHPGVAATLARRGPLVGGAVQLLRLSGTAVRELPGRGELPPPQFSRPEVARLLADGYRAQRG